MGRHGGKVEVEIQRLKLSTGDQILLATDGLTDLVSPDSIGAILKESTSAQSKCEALIALALEQGGKDNVTALLAQYQIPGPGLKPRTQNAD
jgi:serine/threonine protein phosphatase PrpC